MATLGTIYWLPRHADIPAKHHLAISAVDANLFEHPVLLIHQLDSKTGVFCLITTSPGRNLHRPPQYWSQYLPLYPSQPHPSSGLLLTFEGAVVLKQPSWVRLQRFQAPLEVVRPYRVGGNLLGLNLQSLKLVQRELGLSVTHRSRERIKPREQRWNSIADHSTLVDDLNHSQLRQIPDFESTLETRDERPIAWLAGNLVHTEVGRTTQQRPPNWYYHTERAPLLSASSPPQGEPDPHTGVLVTVLAGMALTAVLVVGTIGYGIWRAWKALGF